MQVWASPKYRFRSEPVLEGVVVEGGGRDRDRNVLARGVFVFVVFPKSSYGVTVASYTRDTSAPFTPANIETRL